MKVEKSSAKIVCDKNRITHSFVKNILKKKTVKIGLSLTRVDLFSIFKLIRLLYCSERFPKTQSFIKPNKEIK